MKLEEVDSFYSNKTWRFLIPCIKAYGDTFVKLFNPVYKLAVGIDDLNNQIKGRNFYVLCDISTIHNTDVNIQFYNEFASWLSYHPSFKEEYNIGNSKKMIVFSVPERYNKAYDMFLEGSYSKMFEKEDIDLLFSHNSMQTENKILSLDKSCTKGFIKKINSEFNIEITEKDFDEKLREFELPFKKDEEIFNYKPLKLIKNE